MGFASQISSFFLLASLSLGVREVDALSYVSVSSDDGMFELQWAYNHSKLIFKMKCKGDGWCGVGFSNSSGDGSYHAMVNYDIAAGGVASNTPYLDDYWSTTTTAPSKDSSQNWNLLKASQAAGYTNVEFERNVMTGDIFDVQFKNDTEVWIMWGLHSTDDANDGLTTKHESRGVIKPKHNLVMEAISAGPTPTATNGASEQGSRVVAYAILAFSACALLL